MFRNQSGLSREIDIDPLEGNALFGERDHGALHIRAKLVADQFERGGHGSPAVKCNCIKLNAIASNCQGLAITPPVIGIGTPVVAG